MFFFGGGRERECLFAREPSPGLEASFAKEAAPVESKQTGRPKKEGRTADATPGSPVPGTASEFKIGDGKGKGRLGKFSGDF